MKQSNEEKENVAALKAFAEKGSKVVLVEAVNKQNIRTADCTIDGVAWEVKTNKTSTVSAVDNALHSCNGQSKNLVFNITSDLTEEKLLKGMKNRIRRTNLENIVIERNGVIESVYSREDLTK